MKLQFDKIVFGGRFLLLPMYLALSVTLAVYTLRFSMQTFELLYHAVSYSDTQILVAVLHLLDIIMVSHLIVMIMIGGYVLFIRSTFEDELPEASRVPRLKWLGHIDPGTLKVKMSMSILGVSSIHLLEAFVNAANQSTETLVKLVVVHLVFVVSTVAIAWVNKFAFQHEDGK